MNQVKLMSFWSFFFSSLDSSKGSSWACFAALCSSALVMTRSLIASRFCLKLFLPVLLHLSLIWSMTCCAGYSRVKSSMRSSNLSLCCLLALASSIFWSMTFCQAMC